MSGPLEGLGILDITTVLMGPYATQILGDWGADVIKIEPPAGDISRGVGPMHNRGMGSIFLHLNRSKRSIALDLKKTAGVDVLKRLVRNADVLISNVRPQAMARLGLTFGELSAVNPRLILLSLLGYGQGGPYSGKAAYDDLIQGVSGIPALTARAGGDEPRYAPSAMADRIVGLNAVGAILAAVHARERTGLGQAVEVPMFETMVQFLMGEHMQGATFDPPRGDPGYLRLLAKERKPYRTKDGYICAMIYTDRNWRDFLTLLGEWENYRNDPRIADIGARTRHTSELYGMVEQAMLSRTTHEWLDILTKADIPATPMHTLDTLMQDPHLAAVGFFNKVEHPTEGKVVSMAIPNSWSRTVPTPQRQAPLLGQHTVEILRQASFSQDEIESLLREGIAVAADPADLVPHGGSGGSKS